jgi:hypothetical protein
MMVFARYSPLFLLAAGFCLNADVPAKPVCTGEIAGRFWPDEANDNSKFAAALRPYGYPEICTLENGVYVWKSPTVSVDGLRKAASKKRPILEKAAKP